MSFDADDYVARVLEEDPVLNADSSKWAAVHDPFEPTASYSLTSGGTGSFFTVAWVFGIALGLLWVMRNGRTVFDQWQQNVHRRANRRRHGIPDDDDRPFNVAYAAAATSRRHREGRAKKRVEAARPPSQRDSERTRLEETMRLRQRQSQPTGLDNVPPIFPQETYPRPLVTQVNRGVQIGPGENNDHRTQSRPQPSGKPQPVEAYDWNDLYNPNFNTGPGPAVVDVPQPPTRSARVDASGHRRLDVNASDHAPAERRKHHQLDDASDEDRTIKKSRVDGEEHIDGDNDAVWDVHMPGGSRRGSVQVPKRGSKRHANTEDDDWEMSQDKRPRKGGRKGSSVYRGDRHDAEDMHMADDGPNADPEQARGTKRGRDEVDPTEDSEADGPDESYRIQPLRKRRASGRDESDHQGSPYRGRKRERSHERSTTSDEESEGNDGHAVRHKRSRRVEEVEEDVDIVPADASESDDLPEVADDPSCGGRRIGETWEVNGQLFKVGLDGRRLRHALIRQSRNRFPMPKDSAHRDAKTNVDVIVEKWLNDEEYKAAKENYELAWQDPSPVTTPAKAEVSTKHEEALASSGKHLLWAGLPPSPTKGRASMGPASSAQNPFDLAPSNVGRRVTSVQLVMNNSVESPRLRSAKSFSKWEKQDLEAISLKKMRARMEKQKAETVAAAAPPAPTVTPLAPSTNTQTHTAALTQPNQSTKGPAPSPVAPANPFANPASGTSTTPIPSLSFPKPTNGPSYSAPGLGTQPLSVSPLTTPTQDPTSTSTSTPTAPLPSKPVFSFAPASSPATTPSEPQKPVFQKPLFSSNLPASPLSTASTSTPTFSFGPPASQPNKNDAPKPAFSFGPGSSTPSSEPAKSAIPNFFAKPATQPSSIPAPATASNSPFSFNPTSQTSSFQFGPSSGQSSAPAPSSGGSNSTSLLNRLAPAPSSSNSPQPNAAQNSWSSPFGTGPATPQAFPNSNANISQASSGNPFGQNTPQSQNQNTSVLPSSSNPFGHPQPLASSPSKPALLGPGANGGTELPKSLFGPQSSAQAAPTSSFSQPSGQTTAPPRPAMPSFSFPKPFGQTGPDVPQSQSQSNTPFFFNIAGTSTPGNANIGGHASSVASPNPFNPTPAPSVDAQAKPSGFSFNFGQPSSDVSSSSSPFGFPSTSAGSEKK